MPERVGGNGRRELICASFGRFGGAGSDTDEEGPPSGWPELRNAPAQADELAHSFEKLGYSITRLDPAGSADELGNAVLGAINRSGPSDVLVVHVLSHGTVTPSGWLRVVGGDGNHSHLTEVDSWLRNVVDAQDQAPMTLFLLDICFAGDAARLDWQPRLTDERMRAWVIAASGPGQRAFGGRFTRAITEVNVALANGELDIDPTFRHAPITTVAQRIRRAVAWQAAQGDLLSQTVTASLVDISALPAELPFFPNLRYAESLRRGVASLVDTALRPFLEDLDEALDPVHFLNRAAGYGSLETDTTVGCFTGRGHELRVLSPWLNLQDDVGLRVVTGSPGAGKSSLLGVLVCAAHPLLREHTETIWRHIEQAPYACRSFAAVHARKRGLAEVVSSVARQLGLTAGDAAGLIAAVAGLKAPPVIVVDALDEATEGERIMRELLLPLSQTWCGDDRPQLVRVLAGVRPWAQFEPLIEAARAGGGLVDLDEVTPAQLNHDITRYVTNLLATDRRWNRREYVGAAYSLARAVADELTTNPRQEWGAFLVAGLFTSHVLRTYGEPIRDSDEALALGATVPHSLPGLLDLDLRARGLDESARPVLVVLAHGKGEGMPADTIRQVAAPEPLETQAVLDALEAVRFYLRQSVDPVAGTTLYRLFHQGLADHLWPAGDPGAILDRLLLSVAPPQAEGARQWDVAPSYVLRHIAEHAQAAGRVDELLTDPGYLIAAQPTAVLAVLASASEPVQRAIGELYRSGVGGAHTLADSQDRRVAFVLAAARVGADALVRQLSEMPGMAPLAWQPLWSTAGEEPVTAVAVADVGGASVVAFGTADGSVGVRRAADGVEVFRQQGVHRGAVDAVAIGAVFGRPMLASAGADRVVLVHDLRRRRLFGEPVRRDHGTRRLVLQHVAGRPVVLAVGTSRTVVHDLTTGRSWGELDVAVTPADALWVDGSVVRLVPTPGLPQAASVLSAGRDLTVGHDATITAATVAAIASVPLAFTGDETGDIRAWSLASGGLLGSVRLGAAVTLVRADREGRLFVLTPEGLSCLACRVDLSGEPKATIGTEVLEFATDRDRPFAVAAPAGHPFGVLMPGLGESVTEGTVTRWLKQEGEPVGMDEPLLEVSTDKVDTEIPSPASGVLTQIIVGEDETADVGAVLAIIHQENPVDAEPGPTRPVTAAEHVVAVTQARQETPAEDAVRVTMPRLGESVTEGTVTRWLKSVGEPVEEDEPLLEVSTDKVDTEIPSPASGILSYIEAQEDETVAIGATVAVISVRRTGRSPRR